MSRRGQTSRGMLDGFEVRADLGRSNYHYIITITTPPEFIMMMINMNSMMGYNVMMRTYIDDNVCRGCSNY